jgi:hypothetical protein
VRFHTGENALPIASHPASLATSGSSENQPSVAQCDWITLVTDVDIVATLGFVPPPQTAKISDVMKQLKDKSDFGL